MASSSMDCYAPKPGTRIGVLTWSNRLTQAPFAFAEAIVCAYCERHGYDRLVSKTVRNAAPDIQTLHWQRVPYLIEQLPRYSAILLLDDDLVINQLEQPLEPILDSLPGRDIILSAVERNGRKFQGSPNSGVMIFRNTTFARDFLVKMLTSPDCARFRNMTECCREQDCIWQLMSNGTGVMRTFRKASGRFGLLRAVDLQCRDDRSFHATIHMGTCSAPFAFHAMGAPKLSYVRNKSQLLLPIALRRDWREGRVSLTRQNFSTGGRLPQELWIESEQGGHRRRRGGR